MTNRKLTDAEKVLKYQRKLAVTRQKLARKAATVEEQEETIRELRGRLHLLHGRLVAFHTESEILSDTVWSIAAGCHVNRVKQPE